MDILHDTSIVQWVWSMKLRQRLLADWRLLGDEKFGEKYDDHGALATGIIPARLVYNNEEYTNLNGVSPASCFVFDYKFNHENQGEDTYQIHYIWAD